MKHPENILTILLFLLLPWLESSAQQELTYPEQEQYMQDARALVNAYETGDWEMIRDKVSRDAMFYNLGSFDSLNIDQTIEYWKTGRKTATPVLSDDGSWLGTSVPSGPRAGKWILHWGRNTLTYPNGETISFPYHIAIKFAADKVEEVHFYYDNNRILRGIGHGMYPPSEQE